MKGGRRIRMALAAIAASALTAYGLAVLSAWGTATPPPARAMLAQAAAGDVQALIDAAVPGATVTVPAGVHVGNVVIDRPLTLVGEPGAVLDGQQQDSVLTVSASDVEVANLTFVNGGRNPVGAPSGILVTKTGDRAWIHDVSIERCYLGITVQRARDATLEGVRIVGDGIISGELHAVGDQEAVDGATEQVHLRGDGIWLYDTVGAVVRDSVVETVRDGVYLTFGRGTTLEGTTIADSRYAIHDMNAEDVTLKGNDLRGNLSGVVLMYGGPVRVLDNTITESGSPSTGFGVLVKDAGGVTLQDNVIADNRIGLHVDDAGRTGGDATLVERNTIAMNQIGVLLYPSADATFTGNGFVENTTQVTLGGQGETQAVWSANGVGNYWSDYGGFDAQADGTGDLAYSRSGRTSQLIANDPLLLALASGPAFRLLSAVEDKWAPADPLVLDVAPQTTLESPSLRGDRRGAPVPLWLPGLLMTGSCLWLLTSARRRKVVPAHA